MDSKELQSKREEAEGKKSSPPDTGLPIPDSYDETKLVILPRDPQWIFAYWEFNKGYLSGIKEKYGEDVFQKNPVIIRSYDVTDVIFDGTNAHSYFDVEVNIDAKNWYFQASSIARNYHSEIGILLKNGEFISLTSSNTICMPSGKVSDICDEEWMVVKEDLEKLIKLSGLDLSAKSSQEMVKMLRNRVEAILSSYTVSSPGEKWGDKRIEEEKEEEKEKAPSQTGEDLEKPKTEPQIPQETAEKLEEVRAEPEIPEEKVAQKEEKKQEGKMKRRRKKVSRKKIAPKKKVEEKKAEEREVEEKKEAHVYEKSLEQIGKGMEGLKKGTEILATGVKIAEEKASKILEGGKRQVQVAFLNRKKKNLFTQLGSKVFNLSTEGVKDIMGNKTVKKILKEVEECNEQIKLIKER